MSISEQQVAQLLVQALAGRGKLIVGSGSGIRPNGTVTVTDGRTSVQAIAVSGSGSGAMVAVKAADGKWYAISQDKSVVVSDRAVWSRHYRAKPDDEYPFKILFSVQLKKYYVGGDRSYPMIIGTYPMAHYYSGFNNTGKTISNFAAGIYDVPQNIQGIFTVLSYAPDNWEIAGGTGAEYLFWRGSEFWTSPIRPAEYTEAGNTVIVNIGNPFAFVDDNGNPILLEPGATLIYGTVQPDPKQWDFTPQYGVPGGGNSPEGKQFAWTYRKPGAVNTITSTGSSLRTTPVVTKSYNKIQPSGSAMIFKREDREEGYSSLGSGNQQLDLPVCSNNNTGQTFTLTTDHPLRYRIKRTELTRHENYPLRSHSTINKNLASKQGKYIYDYKVIDKEESKDIFHQSKHNFVCASRAYVAIITAVYWQEWQEKNPVTVKIEQILRDLEDILTLDEECPVAILDNYSVDHKYSQYKYNTTKYKEDTKPGLNSSYTSSINFNDTILGVTPELLVTSDKSNLGIYLERRTDTNTTKIGNSSGATDIFGGAGGLGVGGQSIQTGGHAAVITAHTTEHVGVIGSGFASSFGPFVYGNLGTSYVNAIIGGGITTADSSTLTTTITNNLAGKRNKVFLRSRLQEPSQKSVEINNSEPFTILLNQHIEISVGTFTFNCTFEQPNSFTKIDKTVTTKQKTMTTTVTGPYSNEVVLSNGFHDSPTKVRTCIVVNNSLWETLNGTKIIIAQTIVQGQYQSQQGHGFILSHAFEDVPILPNDPPAAPKKRQLKTVEIQIDSVYTVPYDPQAQFNAVIYSSNGSLSEVGDLTKCNFIENPLPNQPEVIATLYRFEISRESYLTADTVGYATAYDITKVPNNDVLQCVRRLSLIEGKIRSIRAITGSLPAGTSFNIDSVSYYPP